MIYISNKSRVITQRSWLKNNGHKFIIVVTCVLICSSKGHIFYHYCELCFDLF